MKKRITSIDPSDITDEGNVYCLEDVNDNRFRDAPIVEIPQELIDESERILEKFYDMQDRLKKIYEGSLKKVGS